MNTEKLRDALLNQERFAPEARGVLDDLATRTRPRRHLPGWATGLLAAAAVMGIVAGVTTLAGPTTPTPARTTTATAATVAPSTYAAGPTPAISTPAAPTSVDQVQASREVQAQRQAEQAASSAETAAKIAAAAGAAAGAECDAVIRSHPVTSVGAIDPATIRAVASGCANAWGPVGGYTVEWVQTTLGRLQTLLTGHVSHAATPLVAIQVHAVFTKGGQSGLAETMLIHLFVDGTPSGAEVPVETMNLAMLGEVHRLS